MQDFSLLRLLLVAAATLLAVLLADAYFKTRDPATLLMANTSTIVRHA